MCIRDSFCNIDDVLREIEAIGALRGTLPYDIDGAVVKAVSYTHLDVYKRQGLVRPPLSKSGLSHRLQKLEQTAESLKERTRNG